ncbi:hypothetical protein NL676_022218 [Syzygium grande]|nr:hypothetical protein NL676_022218 [Syzygium grande]
MTSLTCFTFFLVFAALWIKMSPEKMLPFAATVAAAGCEELGARTGPLNRMGSMFGSCFQDNPAIQRNQTEKVFRVMATSGSMPTRYRHSGRVSVSREEDAIDANGENCTGAATIGQIAPLTPSVKAPTPTPVGPPNPTSLHIRRPRSHRTSAPSIPAVPCPPPPKSFSHVPPRRREPHVLSVVTPGGTRDALRRAPSRLVVTQQANVTPCRGEDACRSRPPR